MLCLLQLLERYSLLVDQCDWTTGRSYDGNESFGGSTAPYLARALCIPVLLLFFGLEAEGLSDFQG